jgi:hypothetical protein
MRPVLGEQQRAGDDQEADQHQPGTRFHGHALPHLFLMNGMFLH